MRTFAAFLGAVSLCTLASLASAQQPNPKFNVGDSVDAYSFGKWVPCIVSSPLTAGAYNVRCGVLDLKAKADPQTLRPHVMETNGVREAAEVKEVISRQPVGATLGARYGTREPRTCASHKGEMSSSEARDIFICDAEHEFGGSLYLVSDVSLLVSDPRPYSATEDAGKAGIDPSQPVFDIRASYNHYQCNQIPTAMQDYPGTRNCNESKMTNAAGGCFKNQSGEWHCLMYDFHPSAMASASVTNVAPPTLVD